jgi:MAE_28990/MAE_18760-like HEPN
MFEHLTSQLESEVKTSLKVLAVNETIRDLLITQYDFLSTLQHDTPAHVDGAVELVNSLGSLISNIPGKVDWQVYDHCAAVTRIYAAYERFVSDLVGEYVRMLPKLYAKYSELPSNITKQHRKGIGHILSKLGETGRYKNIEEQAVVVQLATGLSGATSYTLLTEAFFIDRQNLRFEALLRLFSSLGFENAGIFIKGYPAIVDFISRERAEVGSVEKELQSFVDYRNEAAHKKVENLLSPEETGAVGRFICALGYALADLIKSEIYRRHMDLKHYSVVLKILETCYGGKVVVGVPDSGVSLRVGDEIVICGKEVCRCATLEDIQLDGASVSETYGDGVKEVGIKLDVKAPKVGELRRLVIPIETPREIQLELAEAMTSLADIADSDLPEIVDQASSTVTEEEDET